MLVLLSVLTSDCALCSGYCLSAIGLNDTGIGVPGIGRYWPVLGWIGYWAIFYWLWNPIPITIITITEIRSRRQPLSLSKPQSNSSRRRATPLYNDLDLLANNSGRESGVG